MKKVIIYFVILAFAAFTISFTGSLACLALGIQHWEASPSDIAAWIALYIACEHLGRFEVLEKRN